MEQNKPAKRRSLFEGCTEAASPDKNEEIPEERSKQVATNKTQWQEDFKKLKMESINKPSNSNSTQANINPLSEEKNKPMIDDSTVAASLEVEKEFSEEYMIKVATETRQWQDHYEKLRALRKEAKDKLPNLKPIQMDINLLSEEQRAMINNAPNVDAILAKIDKYVELQTLKMKVLEKTRKQNETYDGDFVFLDEERKSEVKRG